MSRILSTHGGCLADNPPPHANRLGRHPPGRQTPPWANTPLAGRHPPPDTLIQQMATATDGTQSFGPIIPENWMKMKKLETLLCRYATAFCCLIIYTDTFHNPISLVDTSIVLDTTKLIFFNCETYLAIIASYDLDLIMVLHLHDQLLSFKLSDPIWPLHGYYDSWVPLPLYLYTYRRQSNTLFHNAILYLDTCNV